MLVPTPRRHLGAMSQMAFKRMSMEGIEHFMYGIGSKSNFIVVKSNLILEVNLC